MHYNNAPFVVYGLDHGIMQHSWKYPFWCPSFVLERAEFISWLCSSVYAFPTCIWHPAKLFPKLSGRHLHCSADLTVYPSVICHSAFSSHWLYYLMLSPLLPDSGTFCVGTIFQSHCLLTLHWRMHLLLWTAYSSQIFCSCTFVSLRTMVDTLSLPWAPFFQLFSFVKLMVLVCLTLVLNSSWVSWSQQLLWPLLVKDYTFCVREYTKVH